MILITGCGGYIGRRLALSLLNKGKKVRGLVFYKNTQNMSDLIKLGLEVWKGDLLNLETLDGICNDIDVVYHLAGSHSSSIESMSDLYIKGTKNLLDECNRFSVKSCIIASNGAVYGDHGDRVITEKCELKPTHPFGKITLDMENLAFKYHESKSTSTVILRISEVYGPDEYNFIKNRDWNNITLLGNGENFNSRIFIDDVIHMLELAPFRLSPGRAYNVTDNKAVRQRDFYMDLVKVMNGTAPRWIPLESIPDRIKLSIHGLRALSLRLSGEAITKELNYDLIFPTYKEGIEFLIDLEKN